MAAENDNKKIPQRVVLEIFGDSFALKTDDPKHMEELGKLVDQHMKKVAHQVHSFDSKLYSGTAEGGIFAGDIASNGRYCIVIEGNGYYSALYAYDKNNNQIFKYSF